MSLQALKCYIKELLDKTQKTEQRFFELSQRIEELQKDITVSKMVQKRDAELRKEAQDKFKMLKDLFPNCESYMNSVKLKSEKTTSVTRERFDSLLSKLKRKPLYKESEVGLVMDLDMVLASIGSEPAACLTLRLETQDMEKQIKELRNETQNQINYLSAMLLESENKYLLLIDPSNSDQEIQTDLNW